MSKAELVQIQRSGILKKSGQFLSGFWFAETRQDAVKFGKLPNRCLEKHPVVSAKISKAAADSMHRIGWIDGIGPARYGELDQLRGAEIRW